MGPDTLTTTRENQTFSSVTPPWEMVRAPIYESGACSFRVAGVRSVLGAVLRQLQSALLVFGKVVLGTISHPLGEKEKRPACRQGSQTLFRRVSEMGIKPMNSAAWRARAPPTGMCRHRRATAAPCQNSADAFRPAAKNAGWRKKEVFVPQVCRRFSMEVS